MKQRSNKIHIYVLRKLVVGFLVLSCSLVYGAGPKTGQNNQKPVPAGDTGKEKRTPALPDYNVPNELFPDIPGLTLFFHHPPNKEEAALIMKYATENGLKKNAIPLPRYLTRPLPPTIWILTWDNPKSYGTAMRICSGFPKPPSLESCSLHQRLWVPASVSADQLPPIQYNKDLCGLAKDHQTYWAQNLIGADLLREELKKKSRK